MKWHPAILLVPLLWACPSPPALQPPSDDGGVSAPDAGEGALDTELLTAPPPISAAAEVTFSFRSSAAEATFECRFGADPFSACSSPLTDATLPDGSHVFEVRAVRGREVDPTPAAHAFSLDRVAPATSLIRGPAPLTNEARAELEFESSEPANFSCRLDFSAWAMCASPLVFTSLAEGPHTFEVVATDLVGNVEPTPIAASWSVDLTAPETLLDASEAPTFRFSSTEPDTGFECSLDGAAFEPCVSPAAYPLLGSGQHTFEVRAVDLAGNADASPALHGWTIPPGTIQLRVVAANLTSGNGQDYDLGHGIRIMQGLLPDVVLIQEFNFGANSSSELQQLADSVVGVGAHYVTEVGQIPNGVISRYPILASGVWDDPKVSNREFVWAKIDMPGPRDLWAVSVHFLTSSAANRSAEATALVDYINAHVPVDELLVVGGDFNTANRAEAAITTLSAIVTTSGPHPADQQGVEGTNASRSKPYDWVMPDADLASLQIPTVVGSGTFAAGLVFDSRVFTPLSEVPPVLADDSAAPSMQHMAVVKDFEIPY